MTAVLHTVDCQCGDCGDTHWEAALVARVAMNTADRIATWLKAERAVRKIAGDEPMSGDEEIDAIRLGAWRRSP